MITVKEQKCMDQRNDEFKKYIQETSVEFDGKYYEKPSPRNVNKGSTCWYLVGSSSTTKWNIGYFDSFFHGGQYIEVIVVTLEGKILLMHKMDVRFCPDMPLSEKRSPCL